MHAVQNDQQAVPKLIDDEVQQLVPIILKGPKRPKRGFDRFRDQAGLLWERPDMMSALEGGRGVMEKHM